MEMREVHSLHQPPASQGRCSPRARAAWGEGTQLGVYMSGTQSGCTREAEVPSPLRIMVSLCVSLICPCGDDHD